MGGTSGKSELDKYGVWVKNSVHPVADNADQKEEKISPSPDDKDFLENAAISQAIASEVSKLDETPSQEMTDLQADNLGSFLQQNAQATMMPPDVAIPAQEETPAPQEAGAGDVDLSAFTADEAGGGVDLSAFTNDSPAPDASQGAPDGGVDLSAFMSDSPASSGDGDVDLSAFMDSSPASSADGEVDLSAFMSDSPTSASDGDVDLSAFLGGGDGEVDLSSFMGDSSFGAPKEEEAQLPDEEPLDLDLEFEQSPFELQDENAPAPATPAGETANSNLDDYQSLMGGFAQEASQMQQAPDMTSQEESPVASSGDEEIDLSAFGFDDDPNAMPAAENAPKEKKVETVVDYEMNVDIEEEEDETEKREVKAQDDETDDDDDIKVDISQDSEVAEQKKQETDFSSPDDSFDLDAIFSNIEDESGNAVNFFADESSNEGAPAPDAKPDAKEEAKEHIKEDIIPQMTIQKDQGSADLQTTGEAQETQAADAMDTTEAFLQATAEAGSQLDENLTIPETSTELPIDEEEKQQSPVESPVESIGLDLPKENTTAASSTTEDIVQPTPTAPQIPIMEDEGFAEGKDFLKEEGLLEDEEPEKTASSTKTTAPTEEPPFARETEQTSSTEDTVVMVDVPAEDEWQPTDETSIAENELDEIERIESAQIPAENAYIADITTEDITQENQETSAENDENVEDTVQVEGAEGEIPSIGAEELENLEALDLSAEDEMSAQPLTEDTENEPQNEEPPQEDTVIAESAPTKPQERPLTLQADELASFHEPVPALHEAVLDMAVLSEPEDDEEIPSEEASEPILEKKEDSEQAAKTEDTEESEQKIEKDEVKTMNDEEKKKADDLDVSSYIDKGPDYDMTGVTVTLDDLEKMEATPVVEPESPSPVPQEETATESVEEGDMAKQVYSVFVCNETTSSGEIEEEDEQEEEEPKEKGSESVAILQKIAQELESLKSEISGLRDEFEQFKQSGISAPVAQKDESATQEEGGFFNDDDGDDTIALSGDELSNILSTAEFTSQDAETLEQEETGSTPEPQAEQPAEETSIEVQEPDEAEQASEGNTAEEQQSDAIEQASEPEAQVSEESETIEATVAEDAPQEGVAQEEAQEETEAEPVTQSTTEEQGDVTETDNVAQEEVQEVKPEIAQTIQQTSEVEVEPVPQIAENEPEIAASADVETQEALTPEAMQEETAESPDATQQVQEIPEEQENHQEQTIEPVQEVSDEEVEPPAQVDEDSESINEQPAEPEVQSETPESTTEPQAEAVAETESQADTTEPQEGEAQQTADEAQGEQDEAQSETHTHSVITEEDIPSPTLESLNLPTLAETYDLQEEEAEPLTEDNIEYLKSDVPEEFDEEEENIETGISEQPVNVFSNWSAKDEIEEEASETEEDVATEGEEEISVPKPQAEPVTPPVAADEAEAEPETPQETTSSEPETTAASPTPDVTQEPTSSIETAQQATSSTADVSTGNLMAEIKAVLTYMDRLLENLPDEKIEEVAHSEQFETYKKLFIELGLA